MSETPETRSLLRRLFGKAQPNPEPAAAVAAPPPQSWWQRLRAGLSRSSGRLSQGISDIFTKRKLDAATLEELEDLLIQSDLGLPLAARICALVGKGRYDKGIEPDVVKAILAEEIEWLWQNHHHRQTGHQILERRAQGDAGRRRYIPRRSD